MEKSSYFLNDLRNYNETFRKDVALDNIKSHQKVGFQSFSRKHIFGKTTGGGQTDIRALSRLKYTDLFNDLPKFAGIYCVFSTMCY